MSQTSFELSSLKVTQFSTASIFKETRSRERNMNNFIIRNAYTMDFKMILTYLTVIFKFDYVPFKFKIGAMQTCNIVQEKICQLPATYRTRTSNRIALFMPMKI